MHILYSVTIYPLELAYKFLYLFLAQATGTYGLSLFCLSLVSYAVFHPLKRLAAYMQERERRVQAVLAPQLAEIKAQSRGAERQARTAALYRRYAYHPLMALRSSAGILLQVPFICAAYAMLNSFEPIRGQSAFFGLIPDLGAADGLIGGINLLPLLMTGVNFLAVLTTRGFNRREKLQGGLIALLFLILLYRAPASLLIYWTGNNILMLLENIIRGFASFVPRGASLNSGQYAHPSGPAKKDIRVMKAWNSPAPTLGLAITASCLFMWGQNWHVYTWASLGISLLLVLGVSLLLLFLVGGLARVCGLPAPGWLTVLLWLLVGWLLMEILMILLNIQAGQLAAQLGLKTRYLKIPLALAVFSAVYLARGFRLVNAFFLLWLLLSLGGGLVNIRSAPEGKIAEAGFKVALEKTPDIFLYFLESYHSPYAMRLIYGHDAGPMMEYLRGKNFLVYDQTLSNSSATLTSMADVFTMRPSVDLAWGNSDIAQAGREAVGGSDDNHLFKILKDNGYHTTFLGMGEPYFFQVQGPNLDATDVNAGYYGHWLFRALQPLYDLNPRKLRPLTALYVYLAAPAREFEFQGTLETRVRQATEHGQNLGRPFLVCLFGGAQHTPLVSAGYRGTQREFEAWKPVYLDSVARADKEIKEIVEYLDAAAPDAIVILVGDHGANGYRGILGNEHDLEEVRRRLAERNLTLDAAVQDLFGTLLAIRLPGGEQKDISYGLALNHVNLFRHVFAYLNDDPDLLKTREQPSLSRLMRKLILGRDNHPVLELSD